MKSAHRSSCLWVLLILVLLLPACWYFSPGAMISPGPMYTEAAKTIIAGLTETADGFSTATMQPSATETVRPTVTPSPLPPSPTPTTTSDPYAGLRMDALVSRTYGGGELLALQDMAVTQAFTRTMFAYPSDGLNIFGFMDVPRRGQPPYPVVIALHGYIDPSTYNTLDYTTRYADSLANAGYLVLHPNLRGYLPSDSGSNLLRVGMAIDVLNLIALVKQQSGLPGPLQLADSNAIGLWGHSMGGGISIRVLTVSRDVRAAVLYAPMSGDEKQNFTAINQWSGGTRGLEEVEIPDQELLTISPIFYLDRIQAAISIHHGENDQLIPPEWSADLCQRLQNLGKDVECFTYPGQLHTFSGEGELLLKQRVIDFFNRKLRP